MIQVIGFIVILIVVSAKHELYDGASVYEFEIKNELQVKSLRELEDKYYLDVWSHPGPTRPGYVLVQRTWRGDFESSLKKAGIKHKLAVKNVKGLLEQEDLLLTQAAKLSQNNMNYTVAGLPLGRIYNFDEIESYIERISRKYPKLATMVKGGHSFENRPIHYLRISTTDFRDESKPIVYVQSLLHAREWLSQAATLYAIEKLVVNPEEYNLVTDVDWIIMPVANPDGFVYSTFTARSWRKNRAKGYKIGNVCVGVDLNRNYDINWGTASSSSPCSETFHGRHAFSEPETIVTKKILHKYKGRVEMFLDIHSFGSLILFGYGNGALPPNAFMTNLVAQQMATAIDAVKLRENPNYTVGNSAMLLYPASGCSADYALANGSPLTFTFELPGYRHNGSMAGFLVDPAFVDQAGYETWEGIKIGARYALQSYRKKKGLALDSLAPKPKRRTYKFKH